MAKKAFQEKITIFLPTSTQSRTLNFDPNTCRNESEVESKFIVHYLLPQLGYSPETWHQEVSFGRIRLDFLAFATQVLPFKVDRNSPLSVVIEAKHPKENLDKHTWRLRHYLTKMNVRYGLLTNGKEIRIYERGYDQFDLIFQCLGEEVGDKLEEIKGIIGRENLAQSVKTTPQQPTPQPVVTHPKPNPKRSTMKTIAIYHHKGGVGKTTVSVNLAAALRKKGKRVLLIDIDAQANSTFATGLIKFVFEENDDIKGKNVYHLLESGKQEQNFIPGVVRKSDNFSSPEIDVIPAHITLIGLQDRLIKSAASRFRLSKKLEQVKDNYDIVIIDTPPSRDLYAQASLSAADYLIIPSDLKPFSNQGLPNVIEFIENEINEIKEGLGQDPLKIMGVLASKISTNAQYLKHVYPRHRAVVTDRYKLPLMETTISERTALSHCLNQVMTVGDLEIPDPRSIVKYAEDNNSANISAGEFELLAEEVLEKMEK